LAGDGFLQGTVFNDLDQNSRLDPTDTYLQGATIELLDTSGNPVLDTNGVPLRATTDINGAYLFAGLETGRTYRLRQTAAPNFGNHDVDISRSGLNDATRISANTIEVRLADSKNLTITYDFGGQAFTPPRGFEVVRYEYAGGPVGGQESTFAQFWRVTVAGSDVASRDIATFCIDIGNGLSGGLNHFGVKPTPASAVQLNGGRIAYLYNRYGTDPQFGVEDPPGSTNAIKAAAMQMAIYELQFDPNSTQNDPIDPFSTGHFKVTAGSAWTDPVQLAQIKDQARNYIDESWGKSEAAVYLTVTGQETGKQGMITTGSLNFANKADPQKPPANPKIDVVKLTNGSDNNSPTGPVVLVGSTVTNTYIVTNKGDVPLENVVVTDDKLGTITSFTGDANGNSKLDLTETWTYTATSIATGGQYVNTGTVSAKDAAGTSVTDSDLDHYFGILGASLSGFVYLDRNDDGSVDFDEAGIDGVTITLSGTDDLGQVVALQTVTEEGVYSFKNLRPGTYMITEMPPQPAGTVDGKDTLGTVKVGAVDVVMGQLANDKFSNISLTQGQEGIHYNFGEKPQAGACLAAGRTATIGFWHNKNGQALIKSLNGSPESKQLGNWLADTFPNLYGPTAGEKSLAGKTNAQVAAQFQTLFKTKGMKVEAQILATALAMYVTDGRLAGTAAVKYGFRVTDPGVAYDTLNIGGCGSACGVANHSTVTVIQVLKYVDSQAKNGKLYAEQTCEPVRQILLVLTNIVFTAINERGDI
jgi:hypothetical protein